MTTNPTAKAETDLLELAERCEAGFGADNALDVLIEIALFDPSKGWASVRANSAGTKVVYTKHGGGDHTFWAHDWTMSRQGTARMLRALSERKASL